MNKLFFAIGLLTVVQFATVAHTTELLPRDIATPGCGEWVENTHASCVFAGEDGTPWNRVCNEESVQCRNPHYDRTPCDEQQICVDRDTDPNQLSSICTEWQLVRGVKCVNGLPKWERACQKAWIQTGACSKNYPEIPEAFMPGRFVRPNLHGKK